MRTKAAKSRLAGMPRRTVRLRLTALYGGLFLACGAALLTITYLLVRHTTDNTLIYNSPDGRSSIFSSVTGGSLGTKIAGRNQVHVQADPSTPDLPSLTPEQAEAQAIQFRALAEQQHDAELHQLLENSVIALGVMSVVSIGLGWIVAGRVLRPLRTMTSKVKDISATNLHSRLAMDGPDDELKELGDTFDALLIRLDGSFQAQRMFVANASHELRTPLARQRTIGQVALADPQASVESLREAHERVLAAGRQQEHLIEALLTLARGQAGLQHSEPIDLATVATQIIASRSSEALTRRIKVGHTLQPARMSGDPRLVDRLVANLIDNALVHNVELADKKHGQVEVRTFVRDAYAVVQVSNTGPVVGIDDIDRLLEPFRRLGTERTSHGDGLGVGLSIVQAISDAHKASLRIAPLPTGGLEVEVRFPSAS
jgi:signal transduction histidine kinase